MVRNRSFNLSGALLPSGGVPAAEDVCGKVSGEDAQARMRGLAAMCALLLAAVIGLGTGATSAYALDLQGAFGGVFGQAAPAEPGFVADKVYGVAGGEHAVIAHGKELQVVAGDYSIELSLPGKGETGPLAQYYCVGGEPTVVDNGIVVYDSVSKSHGVLSFDGSSFTPGVPDTGASDENDADWSFYDDGDQYRFDVYEERGDEPARIEMRRYGESDVLGTYMVPGALDDADYRAPGVIRVEFESGEFDEDGDAVSKHLYLSYGEGGLKVIVFDEMEGLDVGSVQMPYYDCNLFAGWAYVPTVIRGEGDESDEDGGYAEKQVWFSTSGKYLPAYDNYYSAGVLQNGSTVLMHSGYDTEYGYDDDGDDAKMVKSDFTCDVRVVDPAGTEKGAFAIEKDLLSSGEAFRFYRAGTFAHYVYLVFAPYFASNDSNWDTPQNGAYDGYVEFYDGATGDLVKTTKMPVVQIEGEDADYVWLSSGGSSYLYVEYPDGTEAYFDTDLNKLDDEPDDEGDYFENLHVKFGSTALYSARRPNNAGMYVREICDAQGNLVRVGDYVLAGSGSWYNWANPAINAGPVKHPASDAYCVTDGQGRFGAVDSTGEVVIPVEYANVLFSGIDTQAALVRTDDGYTYLYDLEDKELVEPAERTDLSSASVSAPGQTYTGSALKPAASVVLNGKTLKAGTEYDVSYANNFNAGMATVTVTGKGAYKGTASAQFAIAKASQTISVSKAASKTVKYKAKKLKKKKATFQIGASAGAGAKLTYALDKKAKKSKKISVSKTGKVTLKKGLKKGTYKITVTASGANYNTATRTVKIKVS